MSLVIRGAAVLRRCRRKHLILLDDICRHSSYILNSCEPMWMVTGIGYFCSEFHIIHLYRLEQLTVELGPSGYLYQQYSPVANSLKSENSPHTCTLMYSQEFVRQLSQAHLDCNHNKSPNPIYCTCVCVIYIAPKLIKMLLPPTS